MVLTTQQLGYVRSVQHNEVVYSLRHTDNQLTARYTREEISRIPRYQKLPHNVTHFWRFGRVNGDQLSVETAVLTHHNFRCMLPSALPSNLVYSCKHETIVYAHSLVSFNYEWLMKYFKRSRTFERGRCHHQLRASKTGLITRVWDKLLMMGIFQ